MARNKNPKSPIATVEGQSPGGKPGPMAEAIRRHEEELTELRTELADLATEIADARALVRQLAERQRELIEEYARLKNQGPEVLPLFDGQAKPAAGPDGWRSEPVEALGVNAGKIRKLAEVGISTLGDLSDWMQAKGEFWAADIKGIGEAAAAEIADRFAAFWAKHPEFCQETSHA